LIRPRIDDHHLEVIWHPDKRHAGAIAQRQHPTAERIDGRSRRALGSEKNLAGMEPTTSFFASNVAPDG
jgi:hypothetical protein